MHCHHPDDVACLLMCQVIACHIGKGNPCFSCEKRRGVGEIHCSSGIMRTVMTTWVVTIWTVWHML